MRFVEILNPHAKILHLLEIYHIVIKLVHANEKLVTISIEQLAFELFLSHVFSF